jgi:hypothetical protein
MIFMVDSGVEHSMVRKPVVAPLTQRRATIIGATGPQTAQQFCQAQMRQLGGHEVNHEFLYFLECPISLLGRDLLTKLGAQITFNQRGPANLNVR